MTSQDAATTKSDDVTGVKLREPQITLEEIKRRVRGTGFICYGGNTCWWAEHTFYTRPIPNKPPDYPGLPCDPRGGMLLQVQTGSVAPDGRTIDALEFIRKAEQNPSHYGRHGIKAFIAAYHGNVLVDGKPWALRDWEDYNRLLDEAGL